MTLASRVAFLLSGKIKNLELLVGIMNR